MKRDAPSVLLAFAGVFPGAGAFVVALVCPDVVAALEALGTLAYCGREFLLVAVTDVRAS